MAWSPPAGVAGRRADDPEVASDAVEDAGQELEYVASGWDEARPGSMNRALGQRLRTPADELGRVDLRTAGPHH